jgi:hypothetical protein
VSSDFATLYIKESEQSVGLGFEIECYVESRRATRVKT